MKNVEEREMYLETFKGLEYSERWMEASTVVRELWLEAIGALQPESQNQAGIEQ
jgi:hypothetical protein